MRKSLYKLYDTRRNLLHNALVGLDHLHSSFSNGDYPFYNKYGTVNLNSIWY